MKQAVNSYSAKTYSARSYSGVVGAGSRTMWMFPRIPNYVWLLMVILTVGAFSYSAYSRSEQQEQGAVASYNDTASRVENARMTNQQIKEQTEHIKLNTQVSARVAQDQLRLVRPNEIVVSLR